VQHLAEERIDVVRSFDSRSERNTGTPSLDAWANFVH
jgi:hypothetical protein